MLPLTQTPGGIQHYTYTGPIGVVGAPAVQSIDITAFPEVLRRDPRFTDQFELIVKALDEGVSNVTNIVFTNVNNVPVLASFDVDSTDDTAEVALFASVRHSIMR